MVKTVGVKVQFPARRRDTSISTNKTFAVKCERDKIIRVLRERYPIGAFEKNVPMIHCQGLINTYCLYQQDYLLQTVSKHVNELYYNVIKI